ncbi:MAG: hypothetical protein U9Q84_02120 [Thermodesulfobacteriota bacterium]|nr:hypothetical protein [Thermodesulfobacteriota bacterium]
MNFAVNSLNSHSSANGARSEALALSMYFQVVMDSRSPIGSRTSFRGDNKLGRNNRKIKPAIFTEGMLFSPLAELQRNFFFDPVRSAGHTLVPSTGATGQAGQARYTLQR